MQRSTSLESALFAVVLLAGGVVAPIPARAAMQSPSDETKPDRTAAQPPNASRPADEDPAQAFIRMADLMPADKRPPNWDEVKRRMARRAPRVGDPAPDFTLKSLDGKQTVTRTKYHPDRPLVLVFGSFT